MKKYLIILIALVCLSFSANAASLCGGGLRYEFSGGNTGTVVLYMPSGDTLKGNYLFDNKNNIRIAWSTGYTNKLIFVSDGVYSDGGNVTLRECK